MLNNELYNILLSDDVVSTINNNLEMLLDIIPELKDIIGFEHKHPHHHLDVWNHTLLALSYSSKEFELRLVLLLHDIGKPHCYQEGEIRHFKGHPQVSSNISYKILKRLNFKDEDINKLCYLIKEHDNPISNKEIINNIELATMKYKVQCCDALAHNPTKLEKRIKYLLQIGEKLNNLKEIKEYEKIILKKYK